MTKTLTFERWVRISATLAAAPAEQRDSFLDRWGYDANEWSEHEKKWSRALCEDQANGRRDRLEAYAAATVAARASLSPGRSTEALLEEASTEDVGARSAAGADVDDTIPGAAFHPEPTLPFQRGALTPQRLAELGVPRSAPAARGEDGRRQDGRRDVAPGAATTILKPSIAPEGVTLPFLPPQGKR